MVLAVKGYAMFRCRLTLASVLILLAPVGANAVREIDYATEDAAYETIKALSHEGLAVRRIAFLPFSGDSKSISPVFRAELARFSGAYEFYTRDEAEWSTLVGEIEFGERRGDIMDPLTVQQFGRIQGVEALLYGMIRDAEVTDDGEGIARFSLNLSEVATGRQLWSGNIEGRYRPPAPIETSQVLTGLLSRLAEDFSAQLKADVGSMGATRVYPLTIVNDRVDAASIIIPELVRAGGDKVQFFSAVSGARGQRMVRKIANEIGGGSGLPSGAQLGRLTRQLDQLFETGGTFAGESGPEAANAVIYGRVRDYDTGKGGARAFVGVTLEIADLNSSRILWGKDPADRRR